MDESTRPSSTQQVAPKDAVASFDSASAFLSSLAAALRHSDFPHLGQSRFKVPLVLASRALPLGLRKQAYSIASGREGIPPELHERMDWAEGVTGDNERITLFVAFNYGGRAEILDAARRFDGTTEDDFRAALYAPEMHEPDLLIRTSGEQRISNFLLWQCAYSELVFRDELWPDFDRAAFEGSLQTFRQRQRRFGGR